MHCCCTYFIYRSYSKHVISLGSSVKSAVLGSDSEFTMADLFTSKQDLKVAARNFKFGLIPKVSSELTTSITYEFLAQDERHYKLWMQALSTVTK